MSFSSAKTVTGGRKKNKKKKRKTKDLERSSGDSDGPHQVVVNAGGKASSLLEEEGDSVDADGEGDDEAVAGASGEGGDPQSPSEVQVTISSSHTNSAIYSVYSRKGDWGILLSFFFF